MDNSLTKSFPDFILFLLFLLNGCSTIVKNDGNDAVIKIGEFIVDQQQYKNQFQRLKTIHDGVTHEEMALFLLDNYISAGLLVETAKKLNYEQLNDFIKIDSTFKEQLVVKYSKYARVNVNKPHRINECIIEKVLQNDIRFDYVRIPKKYEDLSKSMFENLTKGISISNIIKKPELATWDSKGLSFYEDISLKRAILPDEVIHKILTMQDRDVEVIKTKSAYYVIRFLQSVKKPIIDIADAEPVLMNLLMSRSLENGDIIFDSYRLERSFNCNEKLLSKIDFSIDPFHTDNDFVAKIGGQFISENDIKEKISELPDKIQNLFVNKTTRVRAIATLILLNYHQKEKSENTGVRQNS
jgi:hypothetical protein